MLLLVQLDSHKTIYLAISNRGPQSACIACLKEQRKMAKNLKS